MDKECPSCKEPMEYIHKHGSYWGMVTCHKEWYCDNCKLHMELPSWVDIK